VIVVEDDDNIAAALEYVVAREGLTCERLANGHDAISRIRDRRPDLVLLDIMLPGSSGYDVCAEIRRSPELDLVRILMMTARGSASEQRKAISLGADGFISKPFDLADLRREMRRLLAQPV